MKPQNGSKQGRFFIQIQAHIENRLKMLYKLFEWHMLNWLVEESNMKEWCANLLPLDSGWNLEKKKSQRGNKMFS